MNARIATFPLLLAGLIAMSLGGCVLAPRLPVQNPTVVRGNNATAIWEKTVDVLHAYQFPVERENQLDGIIETGYKVGSGVLEPWHYDSVTVGDRLESSFQSIRRRATISVTPGADGFAIGVEVLKEIENPQNLIINSAGYATFPEATPLERDLSVVVGPSSPEGWILLGRDTNLEQQLIRSLQQAYAQP